MAVRTRVYSRLTREALALMGRRIKLARKMRGMSESALAERAGMARSTLQRIEKGDALVEIGLVFEVATLVGVSLFEPEVSSLAPRIAQADDKLALLPRVAPARNKTPDNDF